jgi:hypothetical protein
LHFSKLHQIKDVNKCIHSSLETFLEVEVIGFLNLRTLDVIAIVGTIKISHDHEGHT